MILTDELLRAVVAQESGGNPNAVSAKGAQGLMQIMPATAKNPGYGVKPLQGWDGINPMTAPVEEQLRFGKDYLTAMSQEYGGDINLALAAYNAGPGAVNKYGGIPPYQETQNYVKNVTKGFKMSDNWRSRATPVTDNPSSDSGDWRSRATPVNQPTPAEEPSAVADTSKSIASNLVKGGVDMAMTLPNLVNSAVAGPQYLYKGIKDTFEGNPTDRNFQPYQPFFSSDDVTENSMVDYKPETTPGKLAELPARLLGSVAAPAVVNKASDKMFPGERLTAAQRRNSSQVKYKSVENSGATLDDSVFTDFMNKAQTIRPQSRIQQATGTRDAFDDALDEVAKVSQVKNLSISDVKELDERLTSLAEKARNGGMGTPESRLINQLKYAWRETIDDSAKAGKIVTIKNGKQVQDPKATEAWRGAVRDYATAGRAKDIELIIERAKLTDNPATSIKTGMRNLYLKIQKGQARGYTKQQVEAIRKAADTGISTGIARIAGSRLNPIIALSSSGLDSGVIAGATSKAGRELATKNQVKRAQEVLDLLLGPPVKDAQVKAWTVKNQSNARKASTANIASQLLD